MLPNSSNLNTAVIYSDERLSKAFYHGSTSEHNVQEQACTEQAEAPDPSLAEGVENLRALFKKCKYRKAYSFARQLSGDFRKNSGCSRFLHWEIELLFAKACIYVYPRSNKGYLVIRKVIMEMKRAVEHTPLRDWSEKDLQRWFLFMGMAFHLLGYDHWMNKRNYRLAIEESLQAMEYYEKAGAEEEMATIYDNLGRLYAQAGDQGKAVYHVEKGLSIRSALGLDDRIALSLISFANVWLHFGEVYLALHYLQRAEKICDQENCLRGKSLVWITYGRLYRLLGHQVGYTLEERIDSFDTAVSYLERAQEVFPNRIWEPIRKDEILEELDRVNQDNKMVTSILKSPLLTACRS